MKITLEMPQVAKCAVGECAYNLDQACHAKAVTVGDGSHPACDTFFTAPAHARAVAIRAGVGACKVTDCRHNDDLECTASRIEVGLKGGEADCLTFEPRR